MWAASCTRRGRGGDADGPAGLGCLAATRPRHRGRRLRPGRSCCPRTRRQGGRRARPAPQELRRALQMAGPEGRARTDPAHRPHGSGHQPGPHRPGHAAQRRVARHARQPARVPAGTGAAGAQFSPATRPPTCSQRHSPGAWQARATCSFTTPNAPRASLNKPPRLCTDQPKSQAVALGNLALAHIRLGALDAAVATLNLAIDVTEPNRGGGGMTIICSAGQQLRRQRDSADVQDVCDRIMALMAA
jgi:hypothetical protein